MSKLILVRHGQSEWNLANRFTGWWDVDLTDKGVEEARAAGRQVRVVGTAYSWSRLVATEDVLICLTLMRDVELDLAAGLVLETGSRMRVHQVQEIPLYCSGYS